MSEEFDLSQFEKSMNIRQTTFSDIESIIEIQRHCFPGMEPWEVVTFT